jgi:putative (di)nucleoside polyphosphate hydrolase
MGSLMSNNRDNLYRPCVGMMLLNGNNEVFVGQRIDKTSDAWQMPQGGIDAGEEPLVAAMRELLEEIGTNDVTLLASIDKWLYYDLPPELVPIFWNGKYVGQKQQWFLMRLNDGAVINLNTPHPEFCAYKWVQPQELPSIAVSFKQQLYTDVIEQFLNCL